MTSARSAAHDDRATGRAGSLQSVLDAIASGSATVGELATVSGLDPDLVRLALDRLVALGRVTSDDSALSCPPTGCRACPITAGCPTPTVAGRRPAGRTTFTLARNSVECR